MLSDNAQLVSSFALAFQVRSLQPQLVTYTLLVSLLQVDHRPLFAKSIRDTLAYVQVFLVISRVQ